MQFFFDVLNLQSSIYDFHGRYCDKPEYAVEMAELIAIDLGSSATDDWVGSQVQVRNVAGETLFSIPVLLAA